MTFVLRKIIFSTLFNFSLLTLLIIGIQNSTERKKINLIIGKTGDLPLSFIIGSSFISGSILGSFCMKNKQ